MDLRSAKALSLDLDDTLWGFDAAVSRAEVALHQWLLKSAPSTRDVLTSSASLGHFRKKIAISRLDLAHDPALLRRASIREILRIAGENPDLCDEAYDVFYAERQRVVLFDDVLPALDWLSARYPIAAITNGNSDLNIIGLKHFFQVTIAAKEAGVAKPEPAIFHAAARALDVTPNQILHIGDDWQLDVEGAHLAGLQTAWLKREGGRSVVVGRQNQMSRLLQ
ncbi:HAD family hydrolase [Halomonas aquamarina]|uniref:HAD family hydrolase n=1 Tax=Vreelandella aquamarina TaxID=77097 RepID=A0ACC5VPJ1_9GAMM|nr:HAD family hydrolase [Halomonas aquamarina]MBZ5486052.1 HAD family hydrolase [Halomonas aquamarina]